MSQVGKRIPFKVYKIFDHIRTYAELASFLAVTVGVIIALSEYHDHQQSSIDDAARSTLHSMDEAYRDFLKFCGENPGTDCYSVPICKSDRPSAESHEQRLVYTFLIDIAEEAYLEYVMVHTEKRTHEIFQQEWKAWEVYLKKFLVRPAFEKVWLEVGDEYNPEFKSRVDELLKETRAEKKAEGTCISEPLVPFRRRPNRPKNKSAVFRKSEG